MARSLFGSGGEATPDDEYDEEVDEVAGAVQQLDVDEDQEVEVDEEYEEEEYEEEE